MIALKDMLHEREIKQAIALFKKVLPHKLNAALVEKIIAPNLERINRDLGQENNAQYLAYCVEYCLLHSKIERKPSKHDARMDDAFLSEPPRSATRAGQITEKGHAWSLRGNYAPRRHPARHRKEA